MKRQASAEWRGDLKGGKGTITTPSGVLQSTQYSFGTRFEEGKGTNPEELIAAAHAACFAMALSAQLGEAGMTAESSAPARTAMAEVESASAPDITTWRGSTPLPAWRVAGAVLPVMGKALPAMLRNTLTASALSQLDSRKIASGT